MKLVTLNTWGGRVYGPLLDFFKSNMEVDIFCLQEIYNKATAEKVGAEYANDALNLYTDIREALPDHQGFFRPHIEDCYGLAIFVRKDIKVVKEGDVLIYDVEYAGGGNHSRNLQYIQLEKDDGSITVANIHGLWNGKGKTDTEERILQSQKIKDFMDSAVGSKILCGDFNLLPETESVRILENGMRNLIKEYEVQSTRTSLYTKPSKHADYIFISPDISVRMFKVMDHEVSDHAPLYLEF